VGVFVSGKSQGVLGAGIVDWLRKRHEPHARRNEARFGESRTRGPFRELPVLGRASTGSRMRTGARRTRITWSSACTACRATVTTSIFWRRIWRRTVCAWSRRIFPAAAAAIGCLRAPITTTTYLPAMAAHRAPCPTGRLGRDSLAAHQAWLRQPPLTHPPPRAQRFRRTRGHTALRRIATICAWRRSSATSQPRRSIA
jgi:hypothetical protein